MTKSPASDAPRILFIARSCTIQGLYQEFFERSDTYFCPGNRRETAPPGTKLFTLIAAWKLRQALKAGRYDLVISCYVANPLWRQDQPWWKNLLKLTKNVLFHSNSLGPDLVPWMLKSSSASLTVLDWDDNTMVTRKNWRLLDRATCYFKIQSPRNPYKAFLYQDKRNDCLFNIVRQPHSIRWVSKLRPLSLGVKAPKEVLPLPATPKVTDVFFAGAMGYSWAREEGRHLLKELKAEGYNIDLHCLLPGVVPLPPEEFLRRCAQAWLVWSPEGAGWDCFRHYWAPFMGSVPLLNHPDTRRYQPFIDGIHAFYYGVEGDDIKRVVRLALQDKERLKTMAQEAHDHVLKYHTHHALADYMITETLRTSAPK